MTRTLLNLVNTIRLNGFEVEVNENRETVAIQVVDMAAETEVHFESEAGNTTQLSKELAKLYCTTEQEEAVFARRLRSLTASGQQPVDKPRMR